MKQGFKGSIKSFITNHSSLCIILVYNIVTVAVMGVFYPIIPILMGYAPNAIEVTKKAGVSYDLQYTVLISLAVIIGTLVLSRSFRGVSKWRDLNKEGESDAVKLAQIRKKCINLPYQIYIMQVLIINLVLAIMLTVVMVLTGAPFALWLRIFTVIFSMFSLAGILSLTFSKTIFTRVLIKTYLGGQPEGLRIGLRNKIFLQVLPMVVAAILLTAMLGYSRLMEEKGDLVYTILKHELESRFNNIEKVEDSKQIFEVLKDIKFEKAKISYFVVTPEGKIETSNGLVPGAYFTYYSLNPYDGDRVYNDTNDIQGVIQKVNGKSGAYSAGIRFEMASEKTVTFYLFGFLFLVALNIFVLFYFSRTLAGEISLVTEGLKDIAQGESVDLDRKIPVTSNDELGDLVVAFNRIQEREKEHIKEMQERQTIMMEQERLASLGQLMGGIAHNLRTPIMSISGAIEGLKDLVNEYHDSIDDTNVTKEDHYEIVKEMRTWVEKMRPHCSYMSDIITAVKEQTVQLSTQAGISFTLEELERRIEVLMEHELRKHRCKLNMDFEVLRSTTVQGEISSLVQAMNNLILNAAQSYDGNEGIIDFKVTRKGNNLLFTIKDYGRGIPKDIQEKLFKEMVTTKGKKGTGLGLLMSYSNVKARFSGKMWFESEEGMGTTFYITIPHKA